MVLVGEDVKVPLLVIHECPDSGLNGLVIRLQLVKDGLHHDDIGDRGMLHKVNLRGGNEVDFQHREIGHT